MITLSVERMDSSLMDEMAGLWIDHWKEVSHYPDKIVLAVDREWYSVQQDHGLYLLIAAREEGKLVGYAGFTLMAHPHYVNNIFSNMDVAFLDKEHRKGTVGIKMFKKAEEELKELGVDVIFLRTKVHYNLGPIFERLGYTQAEVAYSKYVGE